ncbi:MAG TPA: tRNA pseudouridine(55) synthase TruB [Deltaproteobacteria bacterium]|nr:tRNA pseudouridine(55) synthase TruB [Deltaproteobacteria bacterium]
MAVPDGVLVIDKPAGPTSHDVVSGVKKALGAGKVGHLGTLDPSATGVLPLVVNGATRCARFLEGDVKEYVVTMRIGCETDTDDADGEVVSRGDWSAVTAGDVTAALGRFVGVVEQVPPMYSAVKHGGTPLYKLARRGREVERKPRRVRVFELEVERVELPDVEFRLRCSKGTYVRSICRDAGRIVGCGAHMRALRRTRSGEFTLDEAVSPDAAPSLLASALIPLERALRRTMKGARDVVVDAEAARAISMGAAPREGLSSFSSSLAAGEMVRFVHGGRLLALGRYSGAGVFRLERVLVAPARGAGRGGR